jgi:hypothetical protein
VLDFCNAGVAALLVKFRSRENVDAYCKDWEDSVSPRKPNQHEMEQLNFQMYVLMIMLLMMMVMIMSSVVLMMLMMMVMMPMMISMLVA